MRRIFKSLTALFIVSASTLSVSCESDRFRQDEGMVWHTTYHITYRADRDMSDSIMATLRDVGASLNVFDPTSLASRLNAGEQLPLDSNYRRVYEMSRIVNGVTKGAFDPTLGPLITAWGFGKGHKATADTLRIDSLLRFTGITKTHIENNMLVKDDPRIEFNFSAIAKGYACDCAGEMLQRNGINDYLVEIGGEIRCSGLSPSGEKWRVSIDRPFTSDSIRHDSQCVVAITYRGMATSGDYRNFHRDAQGAYGHTISATTGRPARTDVLSATVISATAMSADAFATSMMALGSEKAKDLALRLRIPVMLVLADSTVWQNEQFEEIVVQQLCGPSVSE